MVSQRLVSHLEFLKCDDHVSKLCLFFIDNKIIIKRDADSAFLPFQQTINDLNLNVLSAFLDNEIIIIDCESGSQQQLDRGTLSYKTQQVKLFLVENQTPAQEQILRAHHWLNWDKRSKFCGQCGEGLSVEFNMTVKKCLSCQQSFFPRFSPAVMVLIQDNNDRLLLARSPHFPAGRYSAVAGFVEIGESAEQAAHREVKEELGISITELEYFSSQTWPFPDSFMIAFKARYLSGTLKIAPDEIEDARWFDKKLLPELPPNLSISRKLIESVL